ncbi:MAG: sigma-54-dependent Fis family transcriptional regulator [Magnetococcales bacterium]|nr:sigma-54-dependent Fis family transcriptional regulator [Magnetococcales bacterium]
MNKTILIVDDEEPIRTSLRGILEDEEYTVVEAESGEIALEILAKGGISAILLDIWMEGIDGIETLRRIKSNKKENPIDPDLPVVIMSGHGTIDTAVSATKEGAYDFLEKPLSLDRVLLLLDRAIAAFALIKENRALKAKMEDELPPMIGESPAMRQLKEQIDRLAPTDGWVLISGDNGAGKEVAARQIHSLSHRHDGPFIAVSSAAIPEEHIEVELFGREEGSLGSTPSIQAGRFEQANGGTLFLDAVGDMSLRTQAKILRTLQERSFQRVGGNQPIQADVRVIASTSKDLEEEIREGRFRQDLFYRLNVIPLQLPPLHKRLEDIPILVDYFAGLLQRHNQSKARSFAPATFKSLREYHWPGNVRELKNLVERLLIMAPNPIIQPEDLPEFIYKKQAIPASTPWDSLLDIESLREARLGFERIYLKHFLERNSGNISRTSETIGMERSALHRKLKTLGLG